jgi:hypothetical protein
MANIYEITRNLIQMRGEVKAAIITADATRTTINSGATMPSGANLLALLKNLKAIQFTGTIWFESGSYAYLDKDGAGYYWNYIQVPEIPEALKK